MNKQFNSRLKIEIFKKIKKLLPTLPKSKVKFSAVFVLKVPVCPIGILQHKLKRYSKPVPLQILTKVHFWKEL